MIHTTSNHRTINVDSVDNLSTTKGDNVMDVDALRAMVQRLNPERKENPHRELWFKPTEDPTVVRVLPDPNSDSSVPFFEVYWHYDIGGERSIMCPKHYDGSPCPVCDLADDFRSRSGKGKDDPNFKIFLDLQARPRVYAPIIIRGREDEGIKLWGFPGSILQYFVEKITNPDWGDFTHPINGRDVTVQLLKPGTNANPGKYPRPSADLKPGTSPIFKDKAQIKELLSGMPNFMELDPPLFEIKEHSVLVELVKRIGKEDEDTEIEISTATSIDDSPAATAESAPASDDPLGNKLDDLLAD
jgi:hypothetical protein